jgi:LysR family transcriptional regulator, glycine cleavage system transcriptional activator
MALIQFMYNSCMNRNSPSPVALRAFEAAARHLSFTLAAQELYVTQSAVSHQVKALESNLGVRLFVRLTRQLRLTEGGDQLYAVLRDSYDRIQETVDQLRHGAGAGPLRISVRPYFAARWLTRRLGHFSAQHPDIEMHLHLTNEEVDFNRTDTDLSIAWGRGRWAGLIAEHLIPGHIIAVCSPSLVANGPLLERIENLSQHTLLHESNHPLWHDWLVEAGAGNVSSNRNIAMDDPNVVHQAAIEGQGVALGVEALLEDEISQGRLVRLFDRSIELDGSYYLLHSPDARSRLNTSAFLDWMLSETGQTSIEHQPELER